MSRNQVLLFITDEKVYGLDVLGIEAIERLGSITRVPHASQATLGIMNLRGDIVPVISFRQKLGLRPCELDEQMRVIVLGDGDDRVGILVDKVLDVIYIDLDEIYIDKKLEQDSGKSFIKGAIRHDEDNLITILDAVNLITI